MKEFIERNEWALILGGSSGLGLAIVKHLVNNLQGEVGVQSRKEKGSEFWFTLPLS